MIRKLLAALAVSAALVIPAKADSFMCAPDTSGAQTGPRTVFNPGNTTRPIPQYFLNGRGCGMIAPNDVAYFLSQGFQVSPSGGALSVGPLTLTTTTSPTVTMPARSMIENIVVYNGGVSSGGAQATAGNSGDIRVGTTQTGTEVVAAISASAQEVSISIPAPIFTAGQANQVTGGTSTASALLRRTFAVPTTLFIDTAGAYAKAVTAGSGSAVTASVFVTIFYSTF